MHPPPQKKGQKFQLLLFANEYPFGYRFLYMVIMSGSTNLIPSTWLPNVILKK